MLFHCSCQHCCFQQRSWVPWVACLRQQQGWNDLINQQQGHWTGHCESPERRHGLWWRQSNRSYQRDHHSRTNAPSFSNPLAFTHTSIYATNAATSPTSTPNNTGTASSSTGALQFSHWDWWHSGKLRSNGHHNHNRVASTNCRDTIDFDNSVSLQWRSCRTGFIGAGGGKHNCFRRRLWNGIATGWTSCHSGFCTFRGEQSDDNGDHNDD